MAGIRSEKSAKVVKKAADKSAAGKPILLAGGNPQIEKGDGDARVQAYIAATPGCQGKVGRRLDAIIVRTVPGVRKAIKWNTPFYGVEAQGWFLGFHCLTKYVKGGLLPWHVAVSCPSWRVQERRQALPQHLRKR